jgi:hypothetical protein
MTQTPVIGYLFGKDRGHLLQTLVHTIPGNFNDLLRRITVFGDGHFRLFVAQGFKGLVRAWIWPPAT